MVLIRIYRVVFLFLLLVFDWFGNRVAKFVKNDFFKQVEEAESRGATTDELRTLLGKGRAKKGNLEGDLFEGELEIGQVASCIHKLQTVDEVMKELVEDFNAALNRVNELKRFI